MIPKIIHYCWFGGNPLPELAIKCIESWKKYCPDYEIIEWNEANFDINCCDYVQEAYTEKKWAFVSDVARLYALANYGGIYMDTDVEVVNSLDEYLTYNSFAGFESSTRIQTALLGCTKENPLFVELLNDYNDLHFVDECGHLDKTTNVTRITEAFISKGLILNGKEQNFNGITVFPAEVFCPLDNTTGKLKKTEKTCTIHWFDGSWLNTAERNSALRCRKLSKIFGTTLGVSLNAIIYNYEIGGLMQVISKLKSHFQK